MTFAPLNSLLAASKGDADSCACPPEEAAQVLSNEVLEECKIEGMGNFIAFKDGQIWAKFDDRTIAFLDRWHYLCRLVLPYGTSVEVRPAVPVGVEMYIALISDFVVWSFRSPGEHRAALEV